MGPSMERWNLESMGFAVQVPIILVLTGAAEGAVGQVATWSETTCSEEL